MLPDVPYRGLEPYRFCDQAIFFEREVEAERVIRLVTMYRGSILYGESGTGKSSLINAGLIPKVLEAGMAVERIRVQPQSDQEFVVERIARTKSPDLLPSLLARSEDQQRTTLSAATFVETVRAATDRVDLMLIFDQFEELLTLTAEAQGQPSAGQDRILEAIVGLLQDRKRSRLRLLFVFREDYLAKFDRLFYFCPDLPDRFMRLTPPPSSALRRILRGPFETDRIPRGHWKRELSESVVAVVERQLLPSEQGRGISLSKVQITALQLWRSDEPVERLAALGVDGLVTDFLQERLATFRENRATAEALLSLMITRQGTRRVVAEGEVLDEINTEEGTSESRARRALEQLVNDTRLVRRDHNRDTTTYEIVSEFLVPWIRTLKLQRATRRARTAWLRRAGAFAVLLAAVLSGAYYWKYTTLSRDQLVQAATERADAAANEANRARVDLSALQQTLKMKSTEREKKLVEDLQKQ
jgi:hypothetical protein